MTAREVAEEIKKECIGCGDHFYHRIAVHKLRTLCNAVLSLPDVPLTPSAVTDGVALRDWFAMAALTGLLANPTYNTYSGQGDALCGGIREIDAVVQSYRFADAMLQAREERA